MPYKYTSNKEREKITVKTCSFHCPVFPHPSYLHDFGALGSLAGARPAQHEHNLRLHHQRHSVEQARQLLRNVADQTTDHKPRLADPGVIQLGVGKKKKNPTRRLSECGSGSVGRKCNDTTSTIDFGDQWDSMQG